MKRVLLFAAVAFCLIAPLAQAANPVITEIRSKSGIKAWLVEDHQLPLIALRFSFKGGVETDPADKQGLSTLATTLLTQGAGSYDDRAFQDRLAERSINMNIGASRDYVGGELKILRREKEEAFRLLGLALTKPRFDAAVLERERQAQLAAVNAQLSNPGWQGRVALYSHVFGQHPYSFRSLGTMQSVLRITRADVQAFVKQRFAKDTLQIAIVGAVSPQEAARLIDKAFAGLPAHAAPDTIAQVRWPEKTKSILIQREGTQTNIFFAGPMMRRAEPDWYAAQITNYILGGGGFISRLMKAVRGKEGLTYGISTGLADMEKASMLSGTVSVDNNKVADVLALVRSVMKDLYEGGVTEEEVLAAQDYMTGSLPLALTSTDDIAGVLLSLQQDNLGIDFLDRREELYRSVTRDDVGRVIKTWFNPDMISLSLVGKPEGVSVDQTNDLLTE